MKTIGFIGAGTVGTALAVRLAEHHYPVVAVASRTFSSAQKLARAVPGCVAYECLQMVADEADMVFITTPDGAIPLVVGQLRWRKGQNVLHCSGADSLGPLRAAERMGAGVGGFHPLQTFASAAQAVQNLPGSTFAVEADEPLAGILKQMAVDLQGNWVILKADDKVLYHAAAVISCNYMVTLVKLATDLWKTFGVEPQEAINALLPLLRGTLNNISTVGLPNCLTGPVARGDLGTIQKHISSLAKAAPDILSTYRDLGTQTIPIALAKGKVDADTAKMMYTLMSSMKKEQEVTA